MSAQLERLAAQLQPKPAEAERFVAAVNAGPSGRPVAVWPDSAPARTATTVSAGGHLLYTTRTYSLEENERTVAWFLKPQRDWSAVKVAPLAG